ncbi:hypothetical protein D3C71_2135520 [compost metagenome]
MDAVRVSPRMMRLISVAPETMSLIAIRSKSTVCHPVSVLLTRRSWAFVPVLVLPLTPT